MTNTHFQAICLCQKTRLKCMLNTNYSVFKTCLVRLSQTAIDTHWHLLFSNNSIGWQGNFTVFSKLPLWFISFFTVVIQDISVLFCLFFVKDMAQDIAILIKGSWRFLNIKHLYTNPKKHFGHSFAFDAPIVWNDLPDDVHSAPTLACCALEYILAEIKRYKITQ